MAHGSTDSCFRNARSVDLEPDGGNDARFVRMTFTNSGATISGRLFEVAEGRSGHSVLQYVVGGDDPQAFPVHFEVVRTVSWDDPGHLVDDQPCVIGQALRDDGHDHAAGDGYVYFERARYDATAYDRLARDGPILPVNEDTEADVDDDMVVVWYQLSSTGVAWPYKPVRYDCQWPSDPAKLIIANQRGSGALDPEEFPEPTIYHQSDPSKPGYNPNEEQAVFFPPQGAAEAKALFALRSDLNTVATSEPFALLKHRDPDTEEWTFTVYQVVAEEGSDIFRYTGTAGTLIQPPYPLSTMPVCEPSSGVSGPFWEDYKGSLWAKAAGPDEAAAEVKLRYFYRLPNDVWYDLDGDGVPDAEEGTCLPWLDRLPGGTPGTPVDVAYMINWPEDVPELSVGETLRTAKRGLPDIDPQDSVEVIHDEAGVKLLDPLSPRAVTLAELPEDISAQNESGTLVFVDLPFHLRARVSYEPFNSTLSFKGYVEDMGAGEPLLLPNIMSSRERDQLLGLSTDSAYRAAVNALHEATRAQLEGQTKLVGGNKALTAADQVIAPGYVTLAFQNDESLDPLPVSLAVMKVACPLYQGAIKVIPSDNVFDERLTLRHSGDFGGDPDAITFEWRFSPDTNGSAPDGPIEDWQRFPTEPANGKGAVDITIEGPGLLTLSDNWFSVRYRGYEACGGTDTLSAWAGSPGGTIAEPQPQLAEGWIKRVTKGLNPFEARVKDFHKSETNTYASMLIQAGQRYEGDIALTNNPDAINSVGLIEAYTTVLKRGQRLSIDGTPAVDYGPANTALLNAASRIADLYTLLGNEAFADASDPTIGFSTTSNEYGTLAPSIFSFQNQLVSLLEEELVLLRGRDATRGPVNVRPVYNRLFPNFTVGDGEVAYAHNYNLDDLDDDGDEDEADALIQYPQGHGDAWGHYLTAIKTYYTLLRHENYTWVPRTESVLVAGVPLEVDYLDERKFARVAAAKARTGAEIVNLTYRQHYVEDPNGQWQGYKDSDQERAWGLAGWARRAGQGAYFDWVVGNAIVPAEDLDSTHTGIEKIDRSTTLELPEIASHFQAIQAQLDRADQGLNPLGVAHGAVPFDIAPSEIDAGQTHFEQIYSRAVDAMNNAIAVFNHANQQSQLLRRHQDTLEDFRRNVEDREVDFTNRLIEIFGYPYPDDIGPVGTYPNGYDGPDIYHYMYTDPSELMGSASSKVETYTVRFTELQVGPDGGLSSSDKDVTYHLSTSGLGHVKPPHFTRPRRAPGEIQLARSDLLQTKARYERALVDYDNLLEQIEDQASLLRAQHNANLEEINILNSSLQSQTSLNALIRTARERQLGQRTGARVATLIANAMAEFLPTSVGFSTDPTSAARGGIRLAGALASELLSQSADVTSLVEQDHHQAKEHAQALTQISLTTNRNDIAALQQFLQLEGSVRQEALLRLEIYTLQETLQQAAGRYMATLSRGERLLQERIRFRRETASQVQQARYEDMAFRIFRNDALQKYRAQFDLAALYVYLAARAYDFETNLLGSDSQAGQAFLTDIVRQRNIGQIEGGQPLTGSGLADPLARMRANFAVLDGQLGFNNPQTETNRFSLRKERFRISNAHSANSEWQEMLERHRVADLWQVPEFRRYCIPFAPESDGPQPGIVLPLSTNITSGLNYFGWPLGGGDSFYSPTNFTTKIRSIGVWFGNYSNVGLSNTPRVYLVPVGVDVMRTPTGNDLATREWQVVNQSLPLPFPILQTHLDDRDFIPMNDGLRENIADIRRFADFRAHHDSGQFNDAEVINNHRLVGRSVWNTRWLLIVPGATLLANQNEGLDRFIYGREVSGGNGERDGNGVTDVLMFFQTYAFAGN